MSGAKWLGFFPDVFSTIFMQCELNIAANTELSVIVSLPDFKIISCPLILIYKKRFYHAPKNFTCNNTIFGNILKILLNTFLSKRHTFIYILYFFSFSVMSFLQKLILNLLLAYIAFVSSLFIRRARATH